MKLEDIRSELLKLYTDIWKKQLYMEYKFNLNVKLSFTGIGPFGELLSLTYNEGFKGSGSGGMGFDLVNFSKREEIEVKTCATFQPKSCNKCKFKTPKIMNVCSICGSNDLKNMKDSRFGIDAKSMLKNIDEGKIHQLVLIHIRDLELANTNLKIAIDYYSVNLDGGSNNPAYRYFANQRTSKKSNRCNLLPLSYDFYLLNPAWIDSFEIKIDFSSLETPNLIENKKSNVKKLRVPLSILKKSERPDVEKFESYDSKDNTVSCEEFSKNMSLRKKSLGKERGKPKDRLSD